MTQTQKVNLPQGFYNRSGKALDKKQPKERKIAKPTFRLPNPTKA